jgi:hypothetical protein
MVWCNRTELCPGSDTWALTMCREPPIYRWVFHQPAEPPHT